MLTMTKDDYEKILAHCKEGLPNEACGLIGGTKDGDEKHIKKVYLLTNIDESNEHFSMDPKEQLAAVKDMRANGYQLLGNFHSHPESPSRPVSPAWPRNRTANRRTTARRLRAATVPPRPKPEKYVHRFRRWSE